MNERRASSLGERGEQGFGEGTYMGGTVESSRVQDREKTKFIIEEERR